MKKDYTEKQMPACGNTFPLVDQNECCDRLNLLKQEKEG